MFHHQELGWAIDMYERDSDGSYTYYIINGYAIFIGHIKIWIIKFQGALFSDKPSSWKLVEWTSKNCELVSLNTRFTYKDKGISKKFGVYRSTFKMGLLLKLGVSPARTGFETNEHDENWVCIYPILCTSQAYMGYWEPAWKPGNGTSNDIYFLVIPCLYIVHQSLDFPPW